MATPDVHVVNGMREAYGLELGVDVIGELDVEFDEEGALVEGVLPCGHALLGYLLDIARFDDLVAGFDQ